MWGFVYSIFPKIKTPKVSDFEGKLERRQCGNRRRVSGTMCNTMLALKMKDFMAKELVGHQNMAKARKQIFFSRISRRNQPCDIDFSLIFLA